VVCVCVCVQVRDISTNEAWQDAMHLSVPVLALLDSQDQEVSRRLLLQPAAGLC